MHSCRTKTTTALARLAERFAATLITLMLASSSTAVLAGCGDDGEDKPKDAGPTGEPCATPGITEAPCQCGTTMPGYRVCEDNGIWGMCICPSDLPDGATCRDGMRYRCPPCEGETEDRIISCAGGTVDCSCDVDMDLDSGSTSGATDAATDANASDDAG
jgi:hypothetical protein